MRSVITEAKMTKRFNTGDYEFEEFTLGAIVDEKESGASVLTELKKQIVETFNGEVAPESTPAVETKHKKKEEKKNAKSSKANSSNDDSQNDEDTSDEDAGDDGESDQDDEATDDQDGDSGDSESEDADSDEDSASEDDEDEAPAKPAKGSAKGGSKKDGKKYKTKAQTYSRDIEQHKEIFAGILGSVNADWKKSDKTKALARKASEEMDGEHFLDEKGEVLPNFKVMVARILRGKEK